ncbi:MAG TPA: helical backbone metal receptor [Polyangiaceae bacterium]|nr:helical backbone metal receptor [Polyangiaceae bacterium]
MKREARVWDSLGRELILARAPRRIVSLVPSDTYSLVKLGVGERLVGRTRYCVEPASAVEGIPVMGGTKNADVDAIIAARPDLVLANREENTKKDLERIAQAHVAVYVSFPKRVADGLAHLGRLARMLDIADDGKVKEALKGDYEAIRVAEANAERVAPVPTFFPIWMDPLMTIHGDTFISDVLRLGGAANVFADRARRYPLAADLGRAAPLTPEQIEGRDTRYPRVGWDEVVARAPELVLLPDEPHDFTDADVARFQALDIPAARRPHDASAVVKVDGKDFSWYGARSLEGLARVAAVIDRHRRSPPS